MYKIVFIILVSIIFVACGTSKDDKQVENQNKIEAVKKDIDKENIKNNNIDVDKVKNDNDSLNKIKSSGKEINTNDSNKELENPIEFLKSRISVEERSLFESNLVTVTITNTHKSKVISNIGFVLNEFDKDGDFLQKQNVNIQMKLKPSGSTSYKIDEEKIDIKSKKYNVKFVNAVF